MTNSSLTFVIDELKAAGQKICSPAQARTLQLAQRICRDFESLKSVILELTKLLAGHHQTILENTNRVLHQLEEQLLSDINELLLLLSKVVVEKSTKPNSLDLRRIELRLEQILSKIETADGALSKVRSGEKKLPHLLAEICLKLGGATEARVNVFESSWLKKIWVTNKPLRIIALIALIHIPVTTFLGLATSLFISLVFSFFVSSLSLKLSSIVSVLLLFPLGLFSISGPEAQRLVNIHMHGNGILFLLVNSLACACTVYLIGWFAVRDLLTRTDFWLISICYFFLGLTADFFCIAGQISSNSEILKGQSLGWLLISQLPLSLFLLVTGYYDIKIQSFAYFSLAIRILNSLLFAWLVVRLSWFLRKIVAERGTVLRAIFGDQTVLKKFVDFLLGEK